MQDGVSREAIVRADVVHSFDVGELIVEVCWSVRQRYSGAHAGDFSSVRARMSPEQKWGGFDQRFSMGDEFNYPLGDGRVFRLKLLRYRGPLGSDDSVTFEVVVCGKGNGMG